MPRVAPVAREDLRCAYRRTEGPDPPRHGCRLRCAAAGRAARARGAQAVRSHSARLATVFTTGEIVELGWFRGSRIGGHRFMHMRDMLGTGEPILAAAAPRAHRSEGTAP